MEIVKYKENSQHLAELVDLINYCQNIEADLDIKMAEQSDVFNIKSYYQDNNGEFWIALKENRVVGSIALLPINNEVVVLKKFFTYPEFRGDPIRLGAQLFETFLQYALNADFNRVVLDTPENEKRSHFFYEKNGFRQIDKEKLDISYPFPDRDSRIYEKYLP
ncbi:GNAT family N-acetyltransferase [Enterococcus sp. AZ196]|uniref:GNAT family N-acetyltransferase n=1 Tax=Enterococcus sp. AZ196 TaxID=2774659 RepID=UPI003D27B773